MMNTPSKRRGIERIARWAYWAAAWLFLAGVVVQVFWAGMVVVALRMSWVNHISLGHSLGLPMLVMLVGVYLGRFPAATKRLTWLLFAVYVLQADVVIFLRGQAPVIAALHPVLALVDFAVGLALVRAAWSLIRLGPAPTGAQPEMKMSASN